ncbi:MAG: hypothetical protein HY820_01425 [Acidobacteria bacterium]|nr:hypothetical protein [Acidobacteriota bacterium]
MCTRWWFLLTAAALSLAAQDYYPFSINQDQVAGPVDFSSLNRPLTSADRLFVRDGHFYRIGLDGEPNTADDERVRLYGVNLAFSANFPTSDDATRIAKRLRRLGVNLVRLHHMDTQPDSQPSNAASILTTGPYPTLNTFSVDRLKAFLRALSAEGIYIDLNLKVGYTFRPAIDGVPTMSPAIPTQSKPLHIFYPRMVDLQQEFTRNLLDALDLNNDPVLGVVEINNENSMLWEWQVTNLDSKLNGGYLTELSNQWNDHLRARYPDTETLRKAWQPSIADGPQLLGRNWQAELHSIAKATIATTGSAESPQINVTFQQGGDTIIIKQVGFSVDANKSYLAEVEIRADLPAGTTKPVYWDIKQDVSPWRSQTGQSIQVGSEWRKYTMLVRTTFAMDGIGRFGLSIENVGANMQIRGASLHEAGQTGLASSESLTGNSVALVKTNEYSSAGRTRDFLNFLAETDRAYLRKMLAAIREKVGPLVPVAGTQIGFGGLMTIDSHRDLDFHDNHFYVDHYAFPNAAWDGRDWRIRDISSAGGQLGSILNMATARVAGKPYTVSEFNQPWPNQQAAEINPLLSVVGAFQDWDSVMHFAYSHGRGWDNDVPNGFNLNGDWTKWIVFGQSAWLFRTGAIATAAETIDIPTPRAAREQATAERRNGGIPQFLTNTLRYQQFVPLEHAVRLTDTEGTVTEQATGNRKGLVRADTGEFSYDTETGIFRLHADRAAAIIGYTRDQLIGAGPLAAKLGPSARGFLTILLTALDDQPLSQSRRMLLSLPGQTLRTQPSTTRPQQLVNYPGTRDWWTLEPQSGVNKPNGDLNGGSRPTYMERIECTVTLRTAAGTVTVYPLDGSGSRKPALDQRYLTTEEGAVKMMLHAQDQDFAPWYEIVIE